MKIYDFNTFGVGTRPAEAHAELIVHANAPLARTTALQLFEAVTGWRTQIFDTLSEIELLEFAQRRALDIHEASDVLKPEQGLGIRAPERLDCHAARIVTERINDVKRYDRVQVFLALRMTTRISP